MGVGKPGTWGKWFTFDQDAGRPFGKYITSFSFSLNLIHEISVGVAVEGGWKFSSIQ